MYQSQNKFKGTSYLKHFFIFFIFFLVSEISFTPANVSSQKKQNKTKQKNKNKRQKEKRKEN